MRISLNVEGFIYRKVKRKPAQTPKKKKKNTEEKCVKENNHGV